ncbi:hypothetical protein Tco_0769804 [Tanacetum coccineum]|uniref:Uncharacterized protein n=1 Tax=Tanacetum coccineum TaxID=301880 RepID=A0ABQ4ZE22_9ASTR
MTMPKRSEPFFQNSNIIKEHLSPPVSKEKQKGVSPTKPDPNLSRDDYSRYTWVHFLRSKDEAPKVIKTFLKRITVLLQSPCFNRRTKENHGDNEITFDELSAMAFEQSSSKPGFQSMTSGQISSGLDLTYASSTITTQKPAEGDLDLLFEAMYMIYGVQPSSAQELLRLSSSTSSSSDQRQLQQQQTQHRLNNCISQAIQSIQILHRS